MPGLTLNSRINISRQKNDFKLKYHVGIKQMIVKN